MNNLYDYNELPLSNDEELSNILRKVINNEKLSIQESIKYGHDKVFTKIGDYDLKPNCAYRVTDEKSLACYEQCGFIIGIKDNDEYIPGENNAGVDWFLGGACKKYGNILLECPAYTDYFQLVESTKHMSDNPYVKHIKSSGSKNPIPLNLVTIISYDIKADSEKSKSR